MNCKQIVKTKPGYGAVDRKPPDHVCQNIEWKDGFCGHHHPDEIKRRSIKREQKKKAREFELNQAIEPICKELQIDIAIALLVNNGYRVEKIMSQNNHVSVASDSDSTNNAMGNQYPISTNQDADFPVSPTALGHS